MVVDDQTLKMAATDPLYWANLNKIKLQKGVWDIEKRPYLVEPMQLPVLRKLGIAPARSCEMKGTQGGYSEKEINKTLWGLIYGYYPGGVLYLFPTTDDMREFSKSRFGPLIDANPTAIGQFVKDTDTANLKRVGDSFLFLRGATLSQHMEIGGEKESGKLRGITVDKVVYDELDLMDPDVIGKAQGRMGDSTVSEEVYISNPTTPDRGIATMFQKSDQRHWFRKCTHCSPVPPNGSNWEWYAKYWTCAEIEFPDLVKVDGNGKGYIACKRCGKPVGLSPGKWVPQKPENSTSMWGYRWSQLTSPVRDPYEILLAYGDPPDGNIGDVMRLKLGLPYVSAQDRLTAAQVLACCGTQIQANNHAGPCAMGVDIRRHKNVIIGIRSGSDRYTILRVARVETMDEVADMARRFNVRSAVLDVRPYTDEVRDFQKKAKFKCWLCEYLDSSPLGTQYNEQTGIVKVNRTEIFDATHRLVTTEGRLIIPALCPEVKQFAIECSAVARIEETNRRTKSLVFRYVTLDNAPDDYPNALNYFYLAASGHKIAVAGNGERRERQSHAKNEYQRC